MGSLFLNTPDMSAQTRFCLPTDIPSVGSRNVEMTYELQLHYNLNPNLIVKEENVI